jgi:YVTN family beta-propeller protein
LERKTSNKGHKENSLIKVLGTATFSFLSFLILISIAGATPSAYVTNSGDNTVSVVDTATDSIATNVTAGANPQGITVTPDGTKVDADFTSIQEAVNNSVPGDTIIVKSGTYTENVLVNVPELTIRSESNPGNVQVKPLDESKSTFIIEADSTTVTGLNIT